MSKSLELLDLLQRTPTNSDEFFEIMEALQTQIQRLEQNAARAPVGSVKNLTVGPAGAVYAAEMIKQAEKNAKDPSYVPSWNPGKEVKAKSTTPEDLVEVLKNPLISPETRAWLQHKGE